ncbi:MAG: hypothetical protein AAB440_00710 [Patescibacteria group bacterium]
MLRAVFLMIGVLMIVGAFILPPQPAYGPYTWADLISFSDYRSQSVPEIVVDNKETLRMLYQLGIKETMRKVAQDPAYERDDSACHGAAHVVGRMAFNLMGVDALAACTTQCFSGCIHGALQGMGVRSSGSIDALVDDIRVLCSELPTVFERSECIHGAGHGLLLFANYERDDALAACRLLRTREDINDCYTGVFMENLIGDGSEERFTDDLHYPCNEYKDPAVVEACYRLQPSRFIEAHGNVTEARAECMRAPAQAACFMRLGQLSGADTENPPAATEAFCATVPLQFYDDCILGGFRQVIRVNGIDTTGTAAGFCRALTNPEGKRLCYEQYAEELPDLFNDRETQHSLCALFEAPYDVSCLAQND